MVDSMDKNIRTKSKAGASESNQSGYKNSSAGDNIHRYFTELHKIKQKRQQGMQQGISPQRKSEV